MPPRCRSQRSTHPTTPHSRGCRRVIILVKAGKPVDATIDALMEYMEAGDVIIDGGNEWYENSQQRAKRVAGEKNLEYIAMGVSGGEEGARNGVLAHATARLRC